MSQATKLAGAAGGQDPRIGLRSVAALRKLVEQLEALQVRNARGLGWSWQEIADELGVSRQAVHKKHARARILAQEVAVLERFTTQARSVVTLAQ
jgi:predicted DNA-binding protein (UPF0251 family)